MINFTDFKKEIALQISRYVPVKIRKGISKGAIIYGSLFYNRRMDSFNDEEYLYKNLDLKDKIIIEAGAHVGIYTIFFAKQIGKGRVIAFEPNPFSYYLLCKNVKSNSISNVVPVNAGLSNQNDILHFMSPRFNTEKGTFKADKQVLIKENKEKITEIDVPVTTIDNTIKKYSLNNVDFVKIDTEGYEPYVIEGMPDTLERLKPLVYFEIHGLNDSQKQEDLKRIFEFMIGFDYVVVKLSRGLPEVTRDNIKNFSGGGYIASHRITSSLESVLNYFKK